MIKTLFLDGKYNQCTNEAIENTQYLSLLSLASLGIDVPILPHPFVYSSKLSAILEKVESEKYVTNTREEKINVKRGSDPQQV